MMIENNKKVKQFCCLLNVVRSFLIFDDMRDIHTRTHAHYIYLERESKGERKFCIEQTSTDQPINHSLEGGTNWGNSEQIRKLFICERKRERVATTRGSYYLDKRLPASLCMYIVYVTLAYITHIRMQGSLCGVINIFLSQKF